MIDFGTPEAATSPPPPCKYNPCGCMVPPKSTVQKLPLGEAGSPEGEPDEGCGAA